MRHLGRAGETNMACDLTRTISEYIPGRFGLLGASSMAGALQWTFVDLQNDFSIQIIIESSMFQNKIRQHREHLEQIRHCTMRGIPNQPCILGEYTTCDMRHWGLPLFQSLLDFLI